jgi:hypothetical protein
LKPGIGRATLMAIAQALDIPLRDRNSLLLAAGYTPMFSDSAWDSIDMNSVTRRGGLFECVHRESVGRIVDEKTKE